MPRLLPVLLALAGQLPAAATDTAWPDPSPDSRPWVRWWWPGVGIDAESIDHQLEAIASAGFGGVELGPAPAPAGSADEAIEWLGLDWVELASHAAKTAERVGLGFDLSGNDGHPVAVPAGSPELADMRLIPIIRGHRGGPLAFDLPAGTPFCLGAWPLAGPPVDLEPFVTDGHLEWDAPPGSWKIYGAVGSTPASRVLGGSATDTPPALDLFSPAATQAWCDHFTTATALYDAPFPRAFTLEPGGSPAASWTADFFPAFQQRRGYDLREQLPALFGNGDPGTVERVLGDYRETLADLRRESLITWHQWANSQGSLGRARINNTPGHPIDLATVPDIPVTGIDGPLGEEQIPQLAFATSAARLSLKPLVAAEAFGGLGDPFATTPATLKEHADLLFLAGINHLIANGITHSPGGAPWPGGLHPTATHLGDGLWRELPAFTAYLTRCQTILQTGAPDPDVLLYYPAHDFWLERGGIPDHPEDRTHWLRPTAFHRTAMSLWENGVGCDFASDRLLSLAVVQDGRIIIGGLSYQTLILPEVRRLPETTAQILLELTRHGARIAVLGEWPQDVPGYPMPDIRRGTLFASLQAIPFQFLVTGHDPIALVEELGVTPEPMAVHGLRFVRRSHADGHHYFIVNRSARRVDAWVPLAVPAAAAVLMDPRLVRRSGIAPTRNGEQGLEVQLILEPGESRILRTFTEKTPEGPAWTEFTPTAPPRMVTGTWKVEFIEGGPELPAAFESPILGSWTTRDDPAAATFAGTAAYSIDFDLPTTPDTSWLLDLGELAHTARILINGNDAGVAFSPPHQFDITRLIKPGETHQLRIEVTSLPFNRTLHLDQENPAWNRFHDPAIRIPTTSTSAPRPAGLLGPVRLIPVPGP